MLQQCQASYLPEAELPNEQSKENLWGRLDSKPIRLLWLWLNVCVFWNKFWQRCKSLNIQDTFLKFALEDRWKCAGIYTKIRVFVSQDTDPRRLTFRRLGNNYLELAVTGSVPLSSRLHFYSQLFTIHWNSKIWWGGVLISYSCCNKFHKFSGLRQNKMIILQFWILAVWSRLAGWISSGGSRGE